MHTPNNEEQAAQPQSGNTVHRAVVAWLVVAGLAIALAAIMTIEATAAPIAGMSAGMGLERGSALILFGIGALAAFAVTAMMWRDVARQARQALRKRRAD